MFSRCEDAVIQQVFDDMTTFCALLARDALVRTNRRAIAILFFRLSACLSVWDGCAFWSYSARWRGFN